MAARDDRRRHPDRSRLRPLLRELPEIKESLRLNVELARGLVAPGKAWALSRRIEPDPYRYPDIDPAEFRGALAEALGAEPGDPA
jgi:hypothetical protein